MNKPLSFFWRQPGWTLAVAALSLGVWWWTSGEKRTHPMQLEAANRVDYYMENFSALFIDADGDAPFRLRAEFTAHDNIEDVTVLQQPQLEITRPGMARWRVTAGAGIITADDEIRLHDGVNTVREAQGALGIMQSFTPSLTVIPKQGIARGEESVTIFGDNGNVDASTIEIHFNDQRILLQKNVRARYRP